MSRGSVARVPSRWWTDKRFLSLKPDAQRVLVMLWTAPETRLCGFTAFSVALIAERLRLGHGIVRSRLAELEDSQFVRVDPDAAQIWIIEFIEVQLGGTPTASPAWAKNTIAALDALVQTALVHEFRRAYGLLGAVPESDGADGKSAGDRPSRRTGT